MEHSISFEQAKDRDSINQVWDAWLKRTKNNTKNNTKVFNQWKKGNISLIVEYSEVKWTYQPSPFSMYGA